jgi:hypothetical protein
LRRERAEHGPLLPLEALSGDVAGRAMHARIGDLVKPGDGLGIEIGVASKGATIEETLAHVANRALHLALGLRTIGSAGANPEAPVGGEAEELRILEHPAALGPLVVSDHGLELIEEELARDPAEVREGGLQAADQSAHGLVG